MNLRDLEARLQNLIEIDLLSVLPGRKVEDVIVQKLAAAIHQNTMTTDDGKTAVPDMYTLIMHPETSPLWQNEKLLAILLHSITTVAQEAGFEFTISPTITVTSDEKVPVNDAQIVVSNRIETMAETNASPSPLETGNLNDSEKIPENAFLIVEGVKVFPLTVPVVNMGRRLDNQLIIDDPRVSRNHAQLRAIKGRYVLFDLNSTGGTFVNGQRTSQSVLYPGDVISLAGVALIFGQDAPPPSAGTDTASTPGAASDRPTALIKDHSTAKLKKK
jgi:hypothetical protein